MRVCVLTTSYPRWEGDYGGTFVENLARALAEDSGVEADILAPHEAGLAAREVSGGLTVSRLRYFWPDGWQRLAYGNGIPWNLRRSRLAWLNVPFLLGAFAWALLTRGRRSQIIHAHWGILGAMAVLLRPLHRKPVAVSVQGTDMTSKISLIRRVTRFAIRHADAVMTPSTEFWHKCRQLALDPERCFRLLHGVPCPPRPVIEEQRRRKAAAPAGFRIVTVGRLIADRRHNLLIRAVARARKEFPQIRLCIVGGGRQRLPLQELAAQLGVSDCVDVVGLVPSIADYLLDADLYVSPTTVDNFGTAVVEAAAYALPAVTTRVGFPAELVVDGRTGYVVAPDDEDALHDGIIRFLRAGPAEKVEMGWRMRDRIAELGLTWREAAEKVHGIFADCIAERGRRR